MRDFEHVQNVLNKVLFEDMPFHLAVKSSLKSDNKKHDPSFKQEISSVAGSVLRHYYLFKEIISRKYEEASDKNFVLLSIGLANHLFAKKIDEDKLLPFISKETEFKDSKEFILSFNDPTKLIPEDIELNSRKYISLRFNIPLWVVSMWEKNCGPVLSKKLYYSFSRFKKVLLRVNTDVISKDDLLAKYPNFSAAQEDKYVLYEGRENIRSLEAYHNDEIILTPAGYDFMLSKIDIDAFRGIAIYGACENYLIDELFSLLGIDFKADYICGKQKHFFEVKQKLNALHLSNISLYEIESEGMRTCVSKPVHYMFVCPDNSYLAELKERPDAFLRCKQEQLDEHIKEEKKALNSAADLVEEDGYLIYFIPTVCRNETRGVVNAFLNEHNEFSLVEEKQLFPFDKYQTMLYFAILRKEVKHD